MFLTPEEEKTIMQIATVCAVVCLLIALGTGILLGAYLLH